MSVYCEWENLDNVNIDISSVYYPAFTGIYSKAKLYVPTGTIDMYAAQSWTSYFNSITEYTPDGMTVVPDACGTPSIGYENGHLIFSSGTEGASYHYTISNDDVCTSSYSEDGDIILAAAYYIKVYASAEGYANSKTATATLYFVEGTVDSSADDEEGEETSISAAEVRGLVVTSNGNAITVSGLEEGETVEAYDLSGIKLGSATASYGSASVPVRTNASGVAILRIGKQALKVKL
ncbi:MAG: hypothetical protein LUC44_03940 [Prevotellaceae bacterium]|nr:hypothetical protein [Prevotellaceae bacterium]